MGSWFSNIHVRKREGLAAEKVCEGFVQAMQQQGYECVSSAEDADGTLIIVDSESSGWFSVYSNLISFEAPKEFVEIAKPLSAQLHADVMGIADFDSDFLYMNLINTAEKVNAWAAAGHPFALGLMRLANWRAWKKKVSDIEKFKRSFCTKHVFAEDVLYEIEDCLCLPSAYSAASFEDLEEFGTDAEGMKLYFKLTAMAQEDQPPKLIFSSKPLEHCYLETASMLSVLNNGRASKGLSVYFIGPYVEHDEITFSDVRFWKHNAEDADREYTSAELTKVQLQDGQWAYYYHAPDFVLPPKVDERLPMQRQMDLQSERSISLQFTPHGNKRKLLDITVVIVPDANRAGQTAWNVWQEYGSKAEYIRVYNERMSSDVRLPMRIEEFD